MDLFGLNQSERLYVSSECPDLTPRIERDGELFPGNSKGNLIAISGDQKKNRQQSVSTFSAFGVFFFE
jgi:hypothetical protein